MNKTAMAQRVASKAISIRKLAMKPDLLIDDLWDPQKLDISTAARTYDEALSQLNKGGWGTVYLDNDLGPGQKEGWEILNWVMRNLSDEKWPQRFVVFTANNQARPRMESKLKAMGYQPAGTDSKGHPLWERP